MVCQSITFSTHATVRMFARGIRQVAVENVLLSGISIQLYPEDKPFPSVLLLGFMDGLPLHVVAAQDEQGNCIVITAYIPDSAIWESDFKSKKRQ